MRTCDKCGVGIFNTDRYVHKCRIEPYDEHSFARRLVDSMTNPFSLSMNKIVVPNVTAPFLPYEADLIAVDKNFYMKECEIKNTYYSLVQDLKKEKWKKPLQMYKFYFTIDSSFLSQALKVDLPDFAGLIIMERNGRFLWPKVIKKAKANKKSRPISKEKFNQLSAIGCRRLWSRRSSFNSHWLQTI